jgi:hypothetical protein
MKTDNIFPIVEMGTKIISISAERQKEKFFKQMSEQF